MLTFPLTMTALLILLWLIVVSGGFADLILLFQGAAEARRWRTAITSDAARIAMLKSPLVPDLAILAVPPDASPASRSHIQRLLKLHAGNATVVVVLDGASDSDLALWKEEFRLEACDRRSGGFLTTRRINAVYTSLDPIALVVIDKEPGGEADCLNAAINFSAAPLIATVDPHAHVSDEALLLLEPMAAEPDHILAVCADSPFEGAPGFPGRLCRLDFQRNWLKRCALSRQGAVLPSPGAISLLKRDAVILAGGFTRSAAEMVVRLQSHSHGLRPEGPVRYLPVPVSRPNAPRNLRESRLLLARDRSASRSALRSQKLGWLAVSELLRKLYLDPFAETAVLVAAAAAWKPGFIGPVLVCLLLGSALALKILVSMTAVLLAESAAASSTSAADLLRNFLAAVPENLGYRQWRSLWAIGNFIVEDHE